VDVPLLHSISRFYQKTEEKSIESGFLGIFLDLFEFPAKNSRTNKAKIVYKSGQKRLRRRKRKLKILYSRFLIVVI
jgi:hypothetical protein